MKNAEFRKRLREEIERTKYKNQKKWQVKATTAEAPMGKLPKAKSIQEYRRWCKRSELNNINKL